MSNNKSRTHKKVYIPKPKKCEWCGMYLGFGESIHEECLKEFNDSKEAAFLAKKFLLDKYKQPDSFPEGEFDYMFDYFLTGILIDEAFDAKRMIVRKGE